MTATLNHFKVSFLVTHIFNRNKLPFNFNFINYRFHPHVFSFDLKVVTISRKPCYFHVCKAIIHGPSIDTGYWSTSFGVQNIQYYSWTRAFAKTLRKSLQMITVWKNQIVSLTVDVTFSKNSHFWKNSKFSMTLSGPNVTQFVSILTQFTYWIYPCSTQTWITGQVPSYAKTWSIQLKLNWFQLPFSKAFRTLIILNFPKYEFWNVLYRVLNGMMNRRMIFRLSTRSSTTADEQIAQIWTQLHGGISCGIDDSS